MGADENPFVGKSFSLVVVRLNFHNNYAHVHLTHDTDTNLSLLKLNSGVNDPGMIQKTPLESLTIT